MTSKRIIQEHKEDFIPTKYDSFNLVETQQKLVDDFRQNLYVSKAENIIDIQNNIPFISIEEMTSKISFLPLETTEECLIGRIGEIIELDDYYLIGSMELNEIFYYNHVYLFDKKGNFVREIGRQGKGEGEFFYLSCVGYNSYTNQILLMDINGVQCFDLEGNLVNRLRLPFRATRLRVLSKDRIVLFDNLYDDEFLGYLYTTDGDFKNYNVLIPQLIDHDWPFVLSTLSMENGNVYSSFNESDDIYRYNLNDHQISKWMTLKFFDQKKIPWFDGNYTVDQLNKYQNDKFCLSPGFLVTNKAFYFQAGTSSSFAKFCYDLDEKKLFVIKSDFFSSKFLHNLNTFIGNKKLIVSHSVQELYHAAKFHGVDMSKKSKFHFIQSLPEDSNPILTLMYEK